jgi:hypothetical protein
LASRLAQAACSIAATISASLASGLDEADVVAQRAGEQLRLLRDEADLAAHLVVAHVARRDVVVIDLAAAGV